MTFIYYSPKLNDIILTYLDNSSIVLLCDESGIYARVDLNIPQSVENLKKNLLRNKFNLIGAYYEN